MKYPYTMSEERLSLLPVEERLQYDYEHSIYYSKLLREEGMKEYIASVNESYGYFMNEIQSDPEYDDMPLEEKMEIAIETAKLEVKQMYDVAMDFLYESVNENDIPKEDFNSIRKAIYEYYADIDVRKFVSLNESDQIAPGHDMSHWLEGFDGILIGLLGALIGLIAAGKDWLAAKLLKRYMNKIVETIDNGRNKTKSLWNFFGSKNTGNQSQGCFRAILEGVERNRYTKGLIFAKAAGLVGRDPVNDALSHSLENGGLGEYFESEIASKIKDLAN